MHPQRPKLVDQIWCELQDGIEARRWIGWLPQERHLARELNVSRSTLRLALQRLRAAGLLRGLHSQGNQILAVKTRRRQRMTHPLIVNLIVPTVTPLRRASVDWIDKLNALLAARGGQLRVIPADACYAQKPDRALEKLMHRNPADCWLVRLSTQRMQQWLVQHEVPAILVGTGYPGINLPYIDVDHRALSRHATGVIIAAGHRRIALLAPGDLKAGDVESQRGFGEATTASPHRRELQATIARFDGTVASMVRQLDRLFRGPGRTTALVVPHSIYCLTIWSYFGARGIRVPNDLSVIAHVGAMELSYLLPEPAHYRINATTYVQKILRAILARVSDGTVRQEAPILPEFVRGGSIAPPPDS
jgi:DNA-binding LacI/PurR family transcriptional regulator